MNDLENLEGIESGGIEKSDLNLSNIFSVREGGFAQEKGLKTYLSTLTVDELQDDIKFYETLSRDKGWPVSHIIQREVDEERVNSIVKKYILSKGRIIKYFPPIIIALLPRDGDGNFSSTYNFTPDKTDASRDLILDKSKYRTNEEFKKTLSKKENLSIADGIYYFNTIAILDHNLLAWDLRKFYAVVIDGQHRLEALIQAKIDNPDFSSAKQDVIFVDVSPLVLEKKELTPIEIFRTIFIDINTNAKSVGLVRRILMDDKDLASLCVQSLVESITRIGSSKDSNTFIPSVLVDWDGGSLKHELPYITGVLTLYQTINDELVSDRLGAISEHRDLKKISNFISLLNDTFFVDSTIKAQADKVDITTLENSFKWYLKEKESTREMFAEEMQEEALDSILFNYDHRVLEVAQENFEKYFLKSIVSVFAKLKPYVEAINILNELNAFDNSSTLHRALLLSRRKMFVNDNTKNAYVDARQKLTETLNVNYYLLFTVVGQKAIFKCVFERVWANFKHGVVPETIETVFQEFIDQLNSAITLFNDNKFYLFGKEETIITAEDSPFAEFDKIYYSFWEGILFEDKRIVYNSQGIRAFADIINFILKCIDETSSVRSRNVEEHSIRYAQQRIKRLLKKRFTRTEEQYDEIAELMIKNKKQFLLDRINAMLNKKPPEEEKAD